MNKAAATLIVAVLTASSLAGALALGVQSSSRGSHELLAPLRFQLNGRDPYVIELPLLPGQRVACDVNASAAQVTLLLALKGVVLWSYSFSGQSQRQIQADAGGTYSLTFESSSPAEVWVTLSST